MIFLHFRLWSFFPGYCCCCCYCYHILPFAFYSCTWFNADFHEKFVSPGIVCMQKKPKPKLFNTVAVFIKLLFISFAFVLTTGLSKNWKETSSYKVRLIFHLLDSHSHLSYLVVHLILFFSSSFVRVFAKFSLIFAEKNGLFRFCCCCFFLRLKLLIT